MTNAPDQIFASPDREDGWRWPHPNWRQEMTDEELISNLRTSKGWPNLGNAAADRLEELLAEVNEWHGKSMAWIEKWGSAAKDRNTAEAKLAKAGIVALETILDERGPVFDAMVDAAEDADLKHVSFNVVVSRAIRAALAELEKAE